MRPPFSLNPRGTVSDPSPSDERHAEDVGDLPQSVLQSYLDGIADRRINVPIDHVYELNEIRLAHADVESNSATGKLVVRVEH